MHPTGVTKIVGSIPAQDSDFSVALSPVAEQLVIYTFQIIALEMSLSFCLPKQKALFISFVSFITTKHKLENKTKHLETRLCTQCNVLFYFLKYVQDFKQ